MSTNQHVHEPVCEPEGRCPRTAPRSSVECLRAAVDAGEEFASPLGLLVHRFGDQADVLGRIRHRVAEEVDDIEDRFLDEQLPDRSHLGRLRRSTEEFSLVLRDLSGLQERIKLPQEEVAALSADRMNKSIFVLTAAAVVALPINITAGLLGMNVGGIPFGRLDHGFWIVVAALALVTVATAWVLLRRRDD